MTPPASPTHLRILLLADTHLGFDLPTRTRVERRRRGHDFLANYAAALAPALAGEVDVVIHGGDVFDRADVPATLAYQALDPLVRVADRGIPVLIVPGNHERSFVPHNRFGVHRNVHMFDRPRTYTLSLHGRRIALSGFPFEREVRTRFPDVLTRTDWQREDADVRVLCVHHCVEGATVGPADFMFTTASDVIRLRDIPADFAATVSGHIHRHQVLTRDLRGNALRAPVIYPGSIERTSFAEAAEPKGYMLLHVPLSDREAPVRWEFRELYARPMFMKQLDATGMSATQVESAVRAIVADVPGDAVLTIRVSGMNGNGIPAARLRTFVPATMNMEIRSADGSDRPLHSMRRSGDRRAPHSDNLRAGNLSLDL